MSLIDDFKALCVRLKPAEKDDGEGGKKTTWEPAEEFIAAITFDMSASARKAEKDRASSLYTVTVDKSEVFAFHDVFKRTSDGKIFRVTSDSDDKQTPARASFQFAQFTAEEWRLPT